jgi:hypothetical protein
MFSSSRTGRLARRAHAGERDRLLEHLPGGVGVEEERAELVAEPQRAAAVDPERLDVEVPAGEVALLRGLVDELEGDPVVRVAEVDRALDLDVAAVGPDGVYAQQERVRVRLAARSRRPAGSRAP